MPNPFAHIELTTDNLKTAQKFYSKVFAWKLSEMPGMNYTMIDVGGGTGGGMQSKPMPEAPTGWMPYVQVDDVKATIAKASKAGGTAMVPYQEIGEMGAIGVFADPHGAVIGVWESKPAPDARAPSSDTGAAPPPERVVAKRQAAKKAPAKKAPPTKKAPGKSAAAAKSAAPAKSAASAKKASKQPAPKAAQKQTPTKKKGKR